MKLFKRLMKTILLIYFSVGVLLFILQRDFLYFPSEAVIHNYPTLKLLSGDAELNIVVLNQGKKSAILYFGGNAESTVRNADNFLQIFPEHTLYLHNYRGFGGSSGKPTEENLYQDSELVYDSVCVRHEQCSVIGRSLGTGVATYLASTRKINKMILITPYDSIENIAQAQYPIFPISLMLKDKFNSISHVKFNNSKTLVLLAEHDNVIPAKHSQLLIDAFKPNLITVSVIKNTGHNSVSSTTKYNELLHAFLYE